MIDVFMVCVTAIATIVVVGIPFAILWATEAVQRRGLIAKVDAATAAMSKTTEEVMSLAVESEFMSPELADGIMAKVNEAAADISGSYPHRPDFRP